MEKFRILVVDDDDDLRKLIASILQPKYEVVEARDGLEALESLEDCQPDFAILDAVMPGVDGFKLCEAIRRHKDLRGIPVLFISAYATEDLIKKGYASGANLFLPKPVDPIRILKNVEFTIEHEKPDVCKKRYTIEELKDRDEIERRKARERKTKLERERAEPKPKAPRREPLQPKQWPIAEDKSEEVEPPIEEIEQADEESFEEEVAEEEIYEDDLEGEMDAEPLPRVLVVENEEDPRRLIDMVLRENYEITDAIDGVDAIEKIVKYQPDLMLVDIMMPRMNGYQLLQTVRRNKVFGHIPVIVISAKASTRDMEYAMRLGATDFIAKPFDPDDLLRRIELIIQDPDFRTFEKRLSIEVIQQEMDLNRRNIEEDKKNQKTMADYEEMRHVLREEHGDKKK